MRSLPHAAMQSFRARPARGLAGAACISWGGLAAAIAGQATSREFATALCVAAVMSMGCVQAFVGRPTEDKMARVLLRALKAATEQDGGPEGRRHLQVVGSGTEAGA